MTSSSGERSVAVSYSGFQSSSRSPYHEGGNLGDELGELWGAAEYSHLNMFLRPSNILNALSSPLLKSRNLLRNIWNQQRRIKYQQHRRACRQMTRMAKFVREIEELVITYWVRKSIRLSLVHRSTANCFRKTFRLSCFGEVTSKSIDPISWLSRNRCIKTG